MIRLSLRSDALAKGADGIFDGRLKYLLKASPIEEQANKTIIAAIAKAAQIPESRIKFVSDSKPKKSVVLSFSDFGAMS